jgi:uncharacterized BrkB/YihY/UPF0761 family membrane protein
LVPLIVERHSWPLSTRPASLFWVYYSAIIFLYGAEVTQLSAKALGWQLEPIEGAEPLDKELTREKVPAARASQKADRSRAERD